MTAKNNFPTYSSAVHGQSCVRGNLWLTEQECNQVNDILIPYGYKFQLVEQSPIQQSPIQQSPIQQSPIQQDTVSETATPLNAVNPPSNVSNNVINPKKRLKRSTTNLSNKNRATPNIRNNDASSKSTHSHNVTPATRISRRLRKSLTGSWINACSVVTELLEKEPAARWLHVDPINVPDYLEKVFTPMSLQTVKQKLLHGLYTHPFRWQEDIRTIFYNVFTCHSPKSSTWQETSKLAAFFEQLCKNYVGVNPYAVYAPMPFVDPSIASAKSEQRKPKSSARSVTHQDSKPKQNKNSKNIVLKASKLRELLAKVAAVASSSAPPTESETQSQVYSGSRPKVHLPSPTLPSPPPPPMESLRPGEKGPSVVHKRLSQTQFRQLDVHLRYALLDVVKDEFGVLPEVAACDPDFIMDFELLPYLKQKLIVMYLRTLHAFQQKCIDEGYTPTLVTALHEKQKKKEQFNSEATPKILNNELILDDSIKKDLFTLTTPVAKKRSSSSSSSISFDSSSSSSSSSSENDDAGKEGNISSQEAPGYNSNSNQNYYAMSLNEYYGDRGKSVPYKLKSPNANSNFPSQQPSPSFELSPVDNYSQSYYQKDQELFLSVRGKTRPAKDSQLEDKLYESLDEDPDYLNSTSDVAKSVNSSWGEWKAKVIQNKIQLKIGDEKNKEILCTGDTQRERDAELANAEI